MKKTTNIYCFVDGGFNKDEEAKGYGSYKIFEGDDSNKIIYEKERIKFFCSSANESEYAIIHRLLSDILEKEDEFNDITIFSDSKLMVNQVNGNWRTVSENLIPWNREVLLYLKQLEKFNHHISLSWISRKYILKILGH
jgi:ribonuclease HI